MNLGGPRAWLYLGKLAFQLKECIKTIVLHDVVESHPGRSSLVEQKQ